MQTQQKNLIQLKTGQSAVVIVIEGGFGMRRRVNTLGIRVGSKITKVSSHFWRGPVTVRVNSALIALGHGIASRIIVKVEK